MPNKHKNPMLGWHPKSAELGVWVRAEAERRGVPYKEIIEEAVAQYRARLSEHEARREQILRDFAPPQPTIRKQEK
jgi:hypothetical protein